VLYIGVTNDIVRRVAEHKTKINKGFTYKYNCEKLVYYETFALMIEAIAREKQLKNWKREWKNELVNDFNPEWKDLSEKIGVTNELIEVIKANYQEIAGQARNDEQIQAEQKANEEYDEFNKTQKIVSDFDKEIKKIQKKENSD
jgi:putative endonuclease